MNQPTLLADLPVAETATTKPTKRTKASSETEEQARSQAFLDSWRLWHLKQALKGEALEMVVALWHEVNDRE